MQTIRCVALVAFTQFVAHYGQVHGNPDADDAREVDVPVDLVDQLAAEGKIAPLGDKPVLAAAKPVDADGFAMTPVPVGRFRITGPGVPDGTVIKGKKAAEEKLAELRAAHAEQANASAADAAADDAPVE